MVSHTMSLPNEPEQWLRRGRGLASNPYQRRDGRSLSETLSTRTATL